MKRLLSNKTIASLWIAICSIYISAQTRAAYRVAALPSWVEKVEFEKCRFPLDAISDGTCRLLSDIQLKADRKSHQTFFHYADEVINPTGVEGESAIEIDFYPSFETISLHSVAVWRDGIRMNRLVRTNITELRRETGLEIGMMDGAVTLHIIVEDVRPQDIVEYAFTVDGANPIFDGNFFDMQWLAWSAPIQKLAIRLVAPPGLVPARKTLLANVPIREIITNKNTVEYRVTREMVPAVPIEEDIPVWYTPMPSVQFSSTTTWSEVVGWGLPLYKLPAKRSLSLEQEIDDIAAISTDPFVRTEAALKFVQDKIRYLGLEIGKGTHLPTDPSKVIERRFGDCKDKALLLISMLASLGIDAYPALVNLDLLEHVDDMLPSGAAFNHVITAVVLEGKLIFVDPTLRSSPGSFKTLIPPDYGKALILREGESALTTLPARTLHAPIKTIHEQFDLSGGPTKPVDLTVRSVYFDEEADMLRAELEQQSQKELANAFQKTYLGDFPKLKSLSPLKIEKSVDKNQIIVTENYRIQNFWIPRTLKTFEGRIFPREIHDLIATPLDTDRKMPLAVDYPLFVEQTTDVILPPNVVVQETSIRENDDAFDYHLEVQRQKGGCRVFIQYRTKKDHVSAERSALHQKRRDDLSRRMGISFRITPTHPSLEGVRPKTHLLWIVIIAALLAGAAITLLIFKFIYLSRRRKRENLHDTSDQN